MPAPQKHGAPWARVLLESGRSELPAWEVRAETAGARVDVGSSERCAWQVDAQGIAPHHLEMYWDGEVLWVADLQSAGGVTVDGLAVDDWYAVSQGSVIRFGGGAMRVETGGAPKETSGIATRGDHADANARTEIARPGAQPRAQEQAPLPSEASLPNAATVMLNRDSDPRPTTPHQPPGRPPPGAPAGVILDDPNMARGAQPGAMPPRPQMPGPAPHAPRMPTPGAAHVPQVPQMPSHGAVPQAPGAVPAASAPQASPLDPAATRLIAAPSEAAGAGDAGVLKPRIGGRSGVARASTTPVPTPTPQPVASPSGVSVPGPPLPPPPTPGHSVPGAPGAPPSTGFGGVSNPGSFAQPPAAAGKGAKKEMSLPPRTWGLLGATVIALVVVIMMDDGDEEVAPPPEAQTAEVAAEGAEAEGEGEGEGESGTTGETPGEGASGARVEITRVEGEAPEEEGEPAEDPGEEGERTAVRRAVDALMDNEEREALTRYRGLAEDYPDEDAFAAIVRMLQRKIQARCENGVDSEGRPCELWPVSCWERRRSRWRW